MEKPREPHRTPGSQTRLDRETHPTELGKKIRRHLPSIHATLDHGLSNGLIESVNTKIRVITRMAFGFHNPAALIGLAMLALGGLRPALPGR
jgi:transposase